MDSASGFARILCVSVRGPRVGEVELTSVILLFSVYYSCTSVLMLLYSLNLCCLHFCGKTIFFYFFNYCTTLCVSAVFIAVDRCPSVCLSITFVYCIQTAKDIVKIIHSVAPTFQFFNTKHRHPIPMGSPQRGH